MSKNAGTTSISCHSCGCGVAPGAALQAFQADLERRVAFVAEDRALDGDLIALLSALRARAWTLA